MKKLSEIQGVYDFESDPKGELEYKIDDLSDGEREDILNDGYRFKDAVINFTEMKPDNIVDFFETLLDKDSKAELIAKKIAEIKAEFYNNFLDEYARDEVAEKLKNPKQNEYEPDM